MTNPGESYDKRWIKTDTVEHSYLRFYLKSQYSRLNTFDLLILGIEPSSQGTRFKGIPRDQWYTKLILSPSVSGLGQVPNTAIVPLTF